MAASGKTGSALASTGKIVKPGQTRPTSVTSQSSRRAQTTLTSASRRNGASAPVLQSRKSSLVSTTSTTSVNSSSQQRGLKLRPHNQSVLPVLCVYSDQNQLVRKEQFRAPAPASNQAKVQTRHNNENVQAPRSSVPSNSSGSQIPVATQARAIHMKSTISSTARVGNANNNSISNNGAKRSKMTVPRSNTMKVPQPVAAPPSNNKSKGIEKVNRRRNEKSVPPLQSRKAEMTSGVSSSSVGPNQNKPTANPQLPGLSGARPTTTSSSTSSIADGSVRGSVAAQPACRVESTNNVLPLAQRPSTVTSLPCNASKKVTSARNHSKPARISTSCVFAPPRPFHSSVRALVADNPDPKLDESQGSPAVVANHHGPLLVDGAVAAGLADATDTSSVCDRDTNYVVFDYPEALKEPDHYSQVVVGEREEEVKESPLLNQQDHDVMGTYPDTVGYSSEKSTDDASSAADVPQQHAKEDDLLDDFFKFVSNENLRKVTVVKTVQGLGLSVTGGVASSAIGTAGFSPPSTLDAAFVACSWPGLIRIKKIFLHGAAWQTGQLAVGDVLLAANGQPLTGCTNYEALEVLRCSPRETHLLVCRIPSETAEKMGIHPPETPTASYSSHTNWLSPVLTLSTLGEFEISMTKVNGSLGFTLRKEDESILGHYVRSLVKEPAISDGRISPGDKIISVNGVNMSEMSHAEAVAFLRRCPDSVTIRLFRDSAVTPLSPLSPTEPESGLNRPRPLLRQEAQDLLHDLAVRKQGGSRGGSPAPALSGSPCSPRRRRLTKTPSPDLATVVKDRFGSPSSHKDSCCSLPPNFTTSPPMSPLPEMDMERDAMANSLDLTDSNSASFHTPSGTTRASRPDFLDLSNSLVKKQRFMFTPPNDHPPSGFEERQAGDGQPEPPVLDQVELEISEYLTPNRMADSILDNCSRKSFSGSFCIRDDSVTDHPAMGSVLEETMDEEFVSFQSNSTMERYAPQGLSDHDLSNRFPLCDNSGANRGKDGLVKWKGIVLTPDEEYAEEAHLGLIQTIELNKGWNSRLGFSVGHDNDGQLVISAIYDESVAAKDGRLKVGDHVLRVNGEKLEGCPKDYVIDILRKTRGPVAITVRKIA
ncbi:uncharacterized protein LOC130696005 [Daphnia carinata]|uniref:uncharacterized protein LOC130696005 n=1 Tax=Daphnia carinata TaxID=120202 RepID=UPI00257D9B64|nr:uncharacterized protein LOC130696005 [Daphnia carinata]